MFMRVGKGLLPILMMCLILTGCGGAQENKTDASDPATTETGETVQADEDRQKEENEMSEKTMRVQIGAYTFTAALEDNAATEALTAMLEEGPVTVNMRDYAGFEKVGSLGNSLPSIDRQTTTQAGDIVLYQSNQIVMFYGSNSWSYTKLARVEDLTGWEEALGSGNAAVTFSLED